MNKNILPIIVVVLSFFGFSDSLFAQKNDYVVLYDTIYREGYVKQEKSEFKTSLLFKRRKKDSWEKYSLDDVKEYYNSKRKYLKREIEKNGRNEYVFLEVIPTKYEKVFLFRGPASRKQLFLETETDFLLLDDSYREVLSEIVAKPELDPLLQITKLKGDDLAYFLTTASTIKENRTFSKPVIISLFGGYLNSGNKFRIPGTDQIAKVNGRGFQAGLSMEVYTNFLKNVSVTLSPNYSESNGNQFLQFREGGSTFESDFYLAYSNFQLPLTGRYYYDFKPNSWRGYVEAGYAGSFLSLNQSSLKIAEINENSATTYLKDFNIETSYHGFTGGIGIDKVLKKSRAITLGWKYSNLSGAEEKLIGSSIVIGFKF
jgi:hypothetical protein